MARYRNLLAWSALSLTIGTVGFSAMRPAFADVNASTILAQSYQRSEIEGARQGRHQAPDFAAAAAQLGVSEAALKTALGVPETPPELDANGRPSGDRQRPDFAAAAEQLGVSEEALLDALHPEGFPQQRAGERTGERAGARQGNQLEPGARQGRPQVSDSEGFPQQRAGERAGARQGSQLEPGARQGRPQAPDFAAAAAQLGVSEAALKTALGVPETPPELDANGRPSGDRQRPDFAAAAEQLGVSEAALLDALHPEGRPQR